MTEQQSPVPPQAHVLLAVGDGSTPPPNVWPRVVRGIWRHAPGATTLLRPGGLAVITSGEDAVEVLEQAVLPLVVAESKGTVAAASSFVVTSPQEDAYAHLAVIGILDTLVAADLAGSIGGWRHRGAARHAALHLVRPLAWLERAGEMCSAALGEVAALEDFTADDVVAWTSEFTADQEWWLMAPLVAEALTSGALSEAFEDGERVEVGLMTDAVLGVAASALTRAAQLTGRPAQFILDDLLAGHAR